MDLEGLRNGVTDAHTRVERSIGVLKDHLHGAAQGAHVLVGQAGDIPSLKEDLAAIGIKQPHDQLAGGGFSAARLPHQP